MRMPLYKGQHPDPGVTQGSARKQTKNSVSTEERTGSGSGEGGRKDDGKEF
jgi:hypothetical protein